MTRIKRRYRNLNIEKEKTNKKSIYVIAIIVVILIFLGDIFIKYAIDYEKNILPIYNYTIQKNTNYEVALKPNIFYDTETLPSGGYYVSKSINEYIINFEYIFQGDRKTNFKYNYNITANLIGTVKENDNQEKEVWNKNFILHENTSNQYLNVNEFSITEGINIDYEYYNNLARSYEKTYGIEINCVLKLHFNISYIVETSNLGAETQKIEDSIELEIPITNTVTEVKENYEKIAKNSIKPKTENITIEQIIYYIIGGAFILLAIILIIIVLIKNNKKEKEQMYNYNINHILKYYRDLIVTVINKPDFTDLKVMKLLVLEDLIDVAEQNQTNIIHYKEPKKEESNLCVIVDNYVYIYIVTSKQLK